MLRLAIPILSLALAACGGGKDALADRVEQKADARAEALEAQGRNLSDPRQRDIAAGRAQTIRAAGRDQAQAIRQAPLKTDQLSDKEKQRILDARVPEPARAPAR
jgi:regulator of protease activity HflC (stomatin/prohibitin superfamily)